MEKEKNIYNIAAEEQENKRFGWAKKKTIATCCLAAVALLLFAVDYMLFYTPILRANSTESSLMVTFLSVIIAALPIGLAMIMGRTSYACLHKETRSGAHIFATAFCAAALVVYFCISWIVRGSAYSGDNAIVGDLFNSSAVIFSIVAFFADWIYQNLCSRYGAEEKLAEAKRDVFGSMGELEKYEFTSLSDNVRRMTEDSDYRSANDAVVNEGIGLMLEARSKLAERIAKNRDEYEEIVDMPFLVGLHEIQGRTPVEIFDEVCRALPVRSEQEIANDWPVAQNTSAFDLYISDELGKAKKRLNEILDKDDCEDEKAVSMSTSLVTGTN